MRERTFRFDPSDRGVARLVTGRASRHLRYATVALAGTLVLVFGVMAYLEQQYGTVTDNFTANRNVHYVEVTFREGGAADGGALRFADADTIGDVARSAAAGGTQAISEYRIPVGLTRPDGTTVFVRGLSDGGAALVGSASLADGVALGASDSGKTPISVPVVTAHSDGGMTSDKLEHVELDLRRLPRDAPIDVFGTPDPSTLYVDEPTFAHLIGVLDGGVSWSTFRERHDSDANPYGFDAVQAVYVHVDRLSDVDAVGRALDRAGYSTTYTLRAFDDLSGTLHGSLTAGFAVMVGALVLCLVLTFTNLQSYLTLAHRDMGILKHIGYPDVRVRRIYRCRLALTVAAATVPAMLISGAVAASTLASRPMLVAVDLVVLAVLVAVLFTLMGWVQLPRHVRRPVLVLLKLDRQFE